jgi:rfaE bifunctional protein kinase chain/domain
VTRAPLVVVGDALLDRDLDGRAERLAPDAPVPVVDDPAERRRPGGAALAATLAATLDGRAVVLVTALAADEAGTTLRELLELAGVEVVDLGLAGRTPEKIRFRAGGHSLLRVDRATRPGRVRPLGRSGRRALAGARAVLVADYGRGVAAEPGVRAALADLPARLPLVWDPHPRGPAPVRGARLATPNRAEAAGFAPEVPGTSLAAVTARARLLAERWAAAGVAVTLGPGGALLVEGAGAPLVVPASPIPAGDPCGAGDRFAATAAGLLADGALPSEAVAGAVTAATTFVASGGATTVHPIRRGSATPPPAPDHRSAPEPHRVVPGAPEPYRVIPGAPEPHPPGGGAPEREGSPPPGSGAAVVHSPGDHGPGDHGPSEHGPGDHGPDAHSPGAHGTGAHGTDGHRPRGGLGPAELRALVAATDPGALAGLVAGRLRVPPAVAPARASQALAALDEHLGRPEPVVVPLPEPTLLPIESPEVVPDFVLLAADVMTWLAGLGETDLARWVVGGTWAEATARMAAVVEAWSRWGPAGDGSLAAELDPGARLEMVGRDEVGVISWTGVRAPAGEPAGEAPRLADLTGADRSSARQEVAT